MTRLRMHIPEGAERTKCSHCTFGQVVITEKAEHIYCHYAQREVLSPVVRCSQFLSRGSMTLQEMELKGWVLEVKGKQMGFVPPKQRTIDD